MSKSYINPYVVRNHAFTYDQLSKTNYYKYIDDSPEGYKEHMNFNDPSLEIHSSHHHKHSNEVAHKKHHNKKIHYKHHKKASPKKVKGPTKKI